jgi:hypothetical protein
MAVNTSKLSQTEYDKLLQEIVDFSGESEADVVKKLEDAGAMVRVTRDDEGYITDVKYGTKGGSRLNKKTRRSKGRRLNSVRRKLRKLTSRRR